MVLNSQCSRICPFSPLRPLCNLLAGLQNGFRVPFVVVCGFKTDLLRKVSFSLTFIKRAEARPAYSSFCKRSGSRSSARSVIELLIMYAYWPLSRHTLHYLIWSTPVRDVSSVND